jgi:hypothetical protein
VGAGCQTALGGHLHFKPRPAAGAYCASFFRETPHPPVLDLDLDLAVDFDVDMRR